MAGMTVSELVNATIRRHASTLRSVNDRTSPYYMDPFDNGIGYAIHTLVMEGLNMGRDQATAYMLTIAEEV